MPFTSWIFQWSTVLDQKHVITAITTASIAHKHPQHVVKDGTMLEQRWNTDIQSNPLYIKDGTNNGTKDGTE